VNKGLRKRKKRNRKAIKNIMMQLLILLNTDILPTDPTSKGRTM
jgi:hypothetical protein